MSRLQKIAILYVHEGRSRWRQTMDRVTIDCSVKNSLAIDSNLQRAHACHHTTTSCTFASFVTRMHQSQYLPRSGDMYKCPYHLTFTSLVKMRSPKSFFLGSF